MVPLDDIRDAIDQVMRPGHFFAGRTIGLEWGHVPREEVSWEVYHGRLLDPRFARQRQTFEAWNLWQLDAVGRSGEPLLSIKLDVSGRHIYVVRAILTHDWEPYDAGGNVIESRPAQKWVRELAGSVVLASFTDRAELEAELAGLLYQAIAGASRLALTSLEAPLPAFSLGELAYVYQTGIRADQGPIRSCQELIERGFRAERDLARQAKVLEAALRAATMAELPLVSDAVQKSSNASRFGEASLTELLLALFNDVSLSPYTDFVDKALTFAAHSLPIADHVDFLAPLLRRLCRHLTAFDLVTFHHRGANYPDALLLDAALKAYLKLIEGHPDLIDDRLRRRALRQAWLLRRHYEGHLVPDAPTSEGENVRVLPPDFPRVPEEQILDSKRRQRRLFADDPLNLGVVGRQVLEQSLADLEQPGELQELGTALFLDRPLGVFKPPGEPDRTPLLSYVAFSRSVAERWLRELAQFSDIGDSQLQSWLGLLADLEVKGVRLSPPARQARPGAASLADAYQTANDFVLLRTTRRSRDDFVAQLDLASLDFNRWRLVVGGTVLNQPPQTLTVFDVELQPYLEFEFDPAGAMTCRGGREFPSQGLRLLRRAGSDVSGEGIVVHSKPGKHG